jgi:Transketolase, pyrimidine binding domain
MLRRQLPDEWDRGLPTFPTDTQGMATRDASGQVLNILARNVPWLLGGSADLAPSCKTRLTFDGAGDFSAENAAGRNLHFGIREHAMGAILNGLSLSKLRPFGSGFLIFSDYARGAMRLSALMEIPVIHIFTHDSIGVGEDGPTHQPVEQLLSLRAIPGLITLRPADANEVVEAWRVIMPFRHEPVALILTRQALPTLDRTLYASAEGVQRGAYILADDRDGARGLRRYRRQARPLLSRPAVVHPARREGSTAAPDPGGRAPRRAGAGGCAVEGLLWGTAGSVAGSRAVHLRVVGLPRGLHEFPGGGPARPESRRHEGVGHARGHADGSSGARQERAGLA